MKLVPVVVIAAILLVLFVGAPQAREETEALEWNTYEKGMELAQEQQKYAIIAFYGERCVYCIKMDEETFRDKTVAEYLKKYFVPIKVNTDEERTISKDYEIRAVPMGWFVDWEGERIAFLPGYWPPDQFLSALQFIQTRSWETMTFEEFVDDRENLIKQWEKNAKKKVIEN